MNAGGDGAESGAEGDRGAADAPGEACLVVGIGASAGGLNALEGLFRSMPGESALAFVIVVHLAPDAPSSLPELVARFTSLSVLHAEHDARIERGRVYVIQPGCELTVRGGILRVAPVDLASRRSAVDLFFESLAEDQSEWAVGIVLSGAGTDGTRGLRAIRERGGMTIVQVPGSAQQGGMPQSAISRGYADHVLTVDQMPARLHEHQRYLVDRGRLPEACAEDDESLLQSICALLRERVGHDFSQYKPATLLRRVRRRVHVLGLDSLSSYVSQLGAGDEAEHLLRDLLIGVTQFFRDREVFDAIETHVIPRICRDKSDAVRIWVPGCSTGEEAYSLAMQVCENLARSGLGVPVQVFATDIDEEAVQFARHGRYPRGIAEQVSPEQLQRFFTREPDGYLVSKELREMCVFSVHNLLQDPPFSRLDLISCRNLMIYLGSELQREVVPVFHYSLRTGGFLVLGPSEDIGGHVGLFRPLDKKQRIFERLDGHGRLPLQLPWGTTARYSRLPIDSAPRPPTPKGMDPARIIDRLLLDEYGPACVLVPESGEVNHFWGPTSRYLEHPPGAPTLNVIQMAPRSLRARLRAAIRKARSTRATVVRPDLEYEHDGRTRAINLVVRPLSEFGDSSGLLAVIFQEAAPELPRRSRRRAAPSADDLIAQQLESELQATRDHLQATIADLAVSNEELTSSNEELLSMNEELKSANEEIQTSREELQSVNEELETVNAELRGKFDELGALHGDLHNLFQSTRIATIFLDRELRIKRFTPAVTELFPLIDADLGRPITDFAARLSTVDLAACVQEVLRTLQPCERPVRIADSASWYLLRVLPYRTLEDLIAGVVVTFVDITELKRGQDNAAHLAAIVASSQDAIYSTTLDGVITSWNAAAQRMYGHSSEEALGRVAADLLVSEDRRGELGALYERIRSGGRIQTIEMEQVARDRRRLVVSMTLSPICAVEGDVVGIAAIAQDVTERKRTEDELRRSREEIADFIENAVEGLHWVDSEGVILWANRAELEMLGYPAEEYIGHQVADFYLDPPVAEDILRRLAANEVLREQEARLRCKDGSLRHVLISSSARFQNGRFVHTRCFTRDVTDRKRAELALRESEERYRRIAEELAAADRRKDEFLAMLAHELRNPLAPIRHAVHMLASPQQDPAELQRLCGLLERQIDHLARLVDDLLDVARLVGGQIELRREAVAVAEVVRRALEVVQPAIAQERHVLELDLAEPLWVEADFVRLTQVLSNLLQNAAKYTPSGGRIRVSAAAEGAEVVICVRDNGIGIEARMLSRIFELFQQGGRSLDRRDGGLGIGLTLAQRLIVLHGGAITAHSEGVGRGSEFVVRLPRLESGAARLAPAAEPSAVRRAARRRRILVVDDNVDAAEMLAEVLRLHGHDVFVGYDGQQALELADAQRPDIAFIDIGLPKLDGFAVARALRGRPLHARLKLVALTGYGQQSDRERSREAGFDHHMTKPVSVADLNAALVELDREEPTP